MVEMLRKSPVLATSLPTAVGRILGVLVPSSEPSVSVSLCELLFAFSLIFLEPEAQEHTKQVQSEESSAAFGLLFDNLRRKKKQPECRKIGAGIFFQGRIRSVVEIRFPPKIAVCTRPENFKQNITNNPSKERVCTYARDKQY